MDTENHPAVGSEAQVHFPMVKPATSLPAPSDPDFIPPVTKKPSKLRYIWLVIILGLVLSVLAVGAYILDAENRNVPSQVASLLTPTPEMPHLSPTVVPTVTTITASASSDISTWKSYTSEEGFFSLKYPAEYSLSENSMSSVDGVKTNAPNSIELLTPKLAGTSNFAFRITFTFDAAKQTLPQVVSKYATCVNETTVKGEPLQVGGRPALIFKDTPCGPWGSTLIYLKNNSIVYEIELATQASYKDIQQYAEQLLSTVVFP